MPEHCTLTVHTFNPERPAGDPDPALVAQRTKAARRLVRSLWDPPKTSYSSPACKLDPPYVPLGPSISPLPLAPPRRRPHALTSLFRARSQHQVVLNRASFSSCTSHAPLGRPSTRSRPDIAAPAPLLQALDPLAFAFASSSSTATSTSSAQQTPRLVPAADAGHPQEAPSRRRRLERRPARRSWHGRPRAQARPGREPEEQRGQGGGEARKLRSGRQRRRRCGRARGCECGSERGLEPGEGARAADAAFAAGLRRAGAARGEGGAGRAGRARAPGPRARGDPALHPLCASTSPPLVLCALPRAQWTHSAS